MNKLVFSRLVISYLVFIILFFPVLTTYFSQDDFFHFQASLTDGSIGQFLNFFVFKPFEVQGYAFYRPIFREALYHINYDLFGLNPLPFRLLQFLLQFINIYLVYKLIFRIFNKKIVAYLASFLYAISSTNVALLYYLAGGIQAQGATMFVLLTLLLFQKNRLLSFLTFLLALASHEMAIVTPILLAGLLWIKGKKSYFYLIPFTFFTVLFLYLDLIYIGVSKTEVAYIPAFNIKTTLNSSMWYTGWALGLPEMLIDFVPPGLKLDPRLMQYWGNYFSLIFPAFFGVLAILVFSVLKFYKKLTNKNFLFLLYWFPVALLPVIFFPVHKSTYYMAIAMPGFCGALSYIILQNKKIITLALVGLFILLNITSVKLGEITFPAARRAKIAQKLISDIKNQYPTLLISATVFVKDDPNYPFIAQDWGGSAKQASFALSDANAFRLLYHDQSLKVYFEGKDTLPKDDLVFEFVAKIE